MKKSFLLIIVLIILLGGGYALASYFNFDFKKFTSKDILFETPAMEVNNFEDCVRAGNPVMESYPRQCMHEGANYIEVIQPLDSTTPPTSGMSEKDARIIAQKSCIKGGESLTPGTYNAITKTWWFDANLNSTKPGCSPACVVSEDTGTAEINWRCTGLIVPEGPDFIGRKWFWSHTRYSTDQMDTPKNPDVFGLTFDQSGSVAIASDCNSMKASYTAGSEDLSISNILSTKMACADSQESLFAEMLLQVNSYNFGQNGELNLVLKDGKGVMVFK